MWKTKHPYACVQVKARTAEIGLGPEAQAQMIPLPGELLRLVKEATGTQLKHKKDKVSTMFVEDLVETLEKATKAYAQAREGFELEQDVPGDPFLEYVCGLQAFTPEQLALFLEVAFSRYSSKATEPSTPIGAIAAQVCFYFTALHSALPIFSDIEDLQMVPPHMQRR